MKTNPLIFREYDIRGVVEKDFHSETVVAIGRAIGTLMKRKGASEIMLGRDGRLSSERIAGELAAGLASTGLKITDTGLCPTPVHYFSIAHLKKDGGVMVTGSHNPAEFNGIKMTMGRESIFGEEIQEIQHLIEKDDFEKASPPAKDTFSILEPYIDYIVKNLKLHRGVHIAIDSGNGTGGLVAPEIFRRLGCEVYDIFTEVDGRFPNHHPDPTVEANLVDLKKLVADKGLELGVGYDGDADRLGAIDGKGRVLWGDQLMILFSRAILKKHPGAAIIADVKSSENLFADIKAKGGRPIMWKTGHALIKRKLWEEGALFAGEMSGHLFFADRYFGFDDGIYASARLAELVAELEHSIEEELADVPKTYATPEIRVDCPDEQKFEVVQKTRDALRKQGLPIFDLDGVRVTYPGGWGLVRASNTQPVLVLRFEADSPERLADIRKSVESVLSQAGGFSMS
ncbi:phosphomannomutase/phosphoglucomutase [bacterium]|nr:phosphomannomutase/phosphoglucomutase [bacterium]